MKEKIRYKAVDYWKRETLVTKILKTIKRIWRVINVR